MYSESDLEALEKRIGKNVKTRFVDYLNHKGIRNGWGRPFRLQNLTDFWNGKKEDLLIEGYLIDFEEEYNKKRKKLLERKSSLKSPAA
ncbi:hypothetical protein [Leeuwenhoekiella sp. CH_XMU1409-2]|uniref:hypothetical protein n=1 Tax=Leeuwenhoekiella sp. CH_XMU1409-2 TaxID=3107768 RepID=UPI00300B1E38